jgi:hypothetical protein
MSAGRSLAAETRLPTKRGTQVATWPAVRAGIQRSHCHRREPRAYSCLREDVPASPD